MAQDELAGIAERGRETRSDALERIPPREYERDPLAAYDGESVGDSGQPRGSSCGV